MRKIMFLLVALFIVPTCIFAATSPEVIKLDATVSGKDIKYNGETTDGAYAVMCKLFSDKDEELDLLSSPVSENKFDGSFTVIDNGEYKVACAIYEGGEFKTVDVNNLSEISIEDLNLKYKTDSDSDTDSDKNETATIHVKVINNTFEPYFYTWDSVTSEGLGDAWPGNKLTDADADGDRKADVRADADRPYLIEDPEPVGDEAVELFGGEKEEEFVRSVFAYDAFRLARPLEQQLSYVHRGVYDALCRRRSREL